MKLTWPAVTAWRLERHYLSKPAPTARWLDVVTAIGGLHAQLMSAAELSLAIRVEGLDRAHVARALWKTRTLVKAWAMRGTLHLLAARDFPELISVLSTFRHYQRPRWLKYYQVDQADLDLIHDAAREILTDEGITRERLAKEIARRTNRPRLEASLLSSWGSLFKPAAFKGALCFGPSVGPKVTFVRPDRWLEQWRAPQSGAARATVARRYLSAYGPAAPDDFSRWFGVDVATARRIFGELDDELIEVTIEGSRAFALADSVASIRRAKPPNGARLLPYFDPYTVAISRHARYLFPEEHRPKVYRPQGWISPVVLVDGRIVGVWDSKKGKAATEVVIRPFQPLGGIEKAAVEEAAARLEPFWDAKVSVRFRR